MKNKKYFNSGEYDSFTVIASADGDGTGCIRIASGNHVQDRQFCYPKCETFTACICPGETVELCAQGVRIHYGYLFRKDSDAPVRQLNLNRAGNDCFAPEPDDRYRNQNYFHYTAPVGWLNDPVGLCFYRGRYHLFYQFNPASQKWGDAHWGHASSTDLIHWQEHPVVLRPQPEVVCSPAARGGAFSGSALVERGRMHLFFTRHMGDLKKEKCLEYTAAVSSEDGFHFSGERIAVSDLPAGLGCNFRDPKVWKENGEWLMLTGTETDTEAAVAVHRSKDFARWEYQGIFYREKDRRYLRAECPSIVKIAGKYVLIVGYHNRESSRVRRDTVYYIGTVKDYRFQVEKRGLLDYGKDFYAAQIFANLERPVLMAWINDRYETHIEELCRSNGAISLPRKLWIEGNELYSYPVGEVECIEGAQERFGGVFTIEDGRGHLHLDFSEDVSGNLVLAQSEAGRVAVSVSRNRAVIITDHEEWIPDAPVRELDVYTDQSMFEIFINHGMRAFTRRYERYETNYTVRADFSAGCTAVFRRIKRPESG